MSPWLIGCDLDLGQSLGLGLFPGAEQLGGRTVGFDVFDHGVAGHSQFPDYGSQGLSLTFGPLHRLLPGLLGGRGCTFKQVEHRFRLVGSLPGFGPLLKGGLQGGQELPLVSV